MYLGPFLARILIETELWTTAKTQLADPCVGYKLFFCAAAFSVEGSTKNKSY